MSETSFDETVVREYAAGDSFRTIGKRHGMSHESARKIVVRAVREHVDQLELGLMAAQKEGAELTFFIDRQSGPLVDVWVDYVRFMVDELAERGVKVRIRYTPVPDGIALGLVPDTKQPEKKEKV